MAYVSEDVNQLLLSNEACEQLGTTRGKMYLYMQSLRARVGYASLKTLYMEEQARNFPSLTGRDRVNTEMNNAFNQVRPGTSRVFEELEVMVRVEEASCHRHHRRHQT